MQEEQSGLLIIQFNSKKEWEYSSEIKMNNGFLYYRANSFDAVDKGKNSQLSPYSLVLSRIAFFLRAQGIQRIARFDSRVAKSKHFGIQSKNNVVGR